ncbi:MAG: OmpA family protein [Flavobacteriales bacterium]|nr:OmpA family protein [Flavobacteriales bacterium]
MLVLFNLILDVHMRLLYLIFLTLISSHLAIAQNLVQNPGFEEVDDSTQLWCVACLTKPLPSQQKQLFKFRPNHWTAATRLTTPELYDSKSQNKLSVKWSPEKVHSPEGSKFAGLFMFNSGNREFIQNELSKPLVKGQTYCVSLKVRLSDYSKWGVDKIGVLFTERKQFFQEQADILEMQSQLESQTGVVIKERVNWTTLCGQYTALGQEQYLIIGRFAANEQTSIQLLPDYNKLGEALIKTDGAYYLVDEVMVTPLTDHGQCGCSGIPLESNSINHTPVNTLFPKVDSFPTGKNIILDNIYFDIDSSVLLSNSFPQMNKLVEYLNSHPSIHIEISGHTDNTGTDEHNKQLSEDRAKSVADYLYKHGVKEERVKWQGLGSSVPAATNATEEGRKENRRISFTLSNYDSDSEHK